MTLVVSEISKHGIVMVGDSAITRNGHVCNELAAKIQYCQKANVGIAMWGNAHLPQARMDQWTNEFFAQKVNVGDGLEDIGKLFAESMNKELSEVAAKIGWEKLRRGIHLAGYVNNIPRLWHIHCGHDNEPCHELRLYKDWPEDCGIQEEDFLKQIRVGNVYMIRNGYYRHYARLFDQINEFSKKISTLGTNFPADSVDGRIKYQKILVRFVSDVLDTAGHERFVGKELNSIVFDNKGLITNECIHAPFDQTISNSAFNIYY